MKQLNLNRIFRLMGYSTKNRKASGLRKEILFAFTLLLSSLMYGQQNPNAPYMALLQQSGLGQSVQEFEGYIERGEVFYSLPEGADFMDYDDMEVTEMRPYETGERKIKGNDVNGNPFVVAKVLNPEVQFFASRGYAVFQVNYRGSDGYGKAFWTAGFKEWGGLIQDDITDGVQWLIDQKIADPQRIGIFGMGFGGYSAIHGACFNSGLYAAAASYGGFTNLFTHLKEIPPHLKPYLQKYYEIIGNPETESGLIRSMSPVFHADKIEIPVFVAQGGKDSRSSVPEISQFIQKIRKRNIPVTLMLREDEGRYFRKEENRITFYEELGKFFDSHVKKR